MRIPAGVEEVTRGCIVNDGDEKTVVIPSVVKRIANEAFSQMPKLEQVVFEQGSRLEEIGESAFEMCFSLKKIKLPASCKYIGDNAFNSAGVGELEFEEGSQLTEIGQMAFWFCRMKVLDLPNGLRKIGTGCFTLCDSLKEVSVKEGLEEIGELAFEKCFSLESINLPEGVKVIGERAFAGCGSLKQLRMPDSVTVVGERFLDGCCSLEHLSIPKSVKSLSSFPFFTYDVWTHYPPVLAYEAFPMKLSRPSLKHISVSSDNETFCSLDGVVFTKDMKEIVRYPFGRQDEHYEIPEGVERIGAEAFSLCGALKTVKIPDSVHSIGNNAFFDLMAYDEKAPGEEVKKVQLIARKGSFAEKLAEAYLVDFRDSDL